MPTIKIPFPIHEGLEVKNATIDLENRYTVVEYGEKEPKFKKEDIEKDILVPENIQIYRYPNANFGDNLWILFNDINQALGFNSGTNQWIVSSMLDGYSKAKCKLTPCKREDLKAGDTGFWTYESQIKIDELVDITSYCKIINEKDAIYIEHNLTCVCTDDKDIFWYKVEHIQ